MGHYDKKPLFVLKRLGHRLHRVVQELGQERGIEFLAGPQGRVAHYLLEREGEEVSIKDIEQEFEISKSVASNLVKRMVKNDFILVTPSERDKRSKLVHLTPFAREKMTDTAALFDEVDRRILQGISDEDFATFMKVVDQFDHNIEQLKGV